eukprot:SAG11_NODE_92_length_17132_cov_10.277285_4_plen_174_part_00
MILSAWIAITSTDGQNGMLQLIPGSHRSAVPHIPVSASETKMAFQEKADPSHVDASGALALPMRAGQFVLFNERTMHHSAPNTTEQRRLGLAVRVVPPLVRVLSYDKNMVGEHALVPLPRFDVQDSADSDNGEPPPLPSTGTATVSETLGINRLASAPFTARCSNGIVALARL